MITTIQDDFLSAPPRPGNGSDTAGIEPNWRDRAAEQALRAMALDGSGSDALLLEIRRSRPGCATLLLNPDRLRLRRFLDLHTTDVRSLLTGSDGHIERDEVCPYIGWYGATWQGATVELALTPSVYVSGYTIVIGDDAPTLRKFADALDDYATRPEGRCLRYSGEWESAPDLDSEIGKVTWDDIVLPPRVLDEVRDGVEGFFRYRESFELLGFPWRRGLLLVGPPGTGKTMICKAAAAALPDLPFLYVRDFSGNAGRDATEEIFARARHLSPCLLAFEDIDGLVGQGNRTVFLNELDGFQNNNGLLIIASSNHPGKIDEALLKRPSRFDRVYHIGLPAPAERKTYCLRLLSRSTLAARLAPDFDAEKLSNTVAEWSEGFTPAYLKEAFIAAALKQAQEGATVLDESFANAVISQVEELKKQLRKVQNPDSLGEFASPDAAGMGLRRK